MKLSGKITFGLVLVCFLLVLSGCGKLGEKEAEEMVKKACRIPDSFKKVEYQVDEKNGISYLDYKAKNALGVELPGRVYFMVSKDRLEPLDTDGIPNNQAEAIYKANPKQFVEGVAAYKHLKQIKDKHKFEIDLFLDRYKQLNVEKSFFSWDYARKESYKINNIIKEYKETYEGAPEVVKQFFDKPMKYFKIEVNGSYIGGWSARGNVVDDYPDPNSAQ